MSNYDFFQHKTCEYFPCHPGADTDTFSCIFCYCPLYALGDKCGGDFTYTNDGFKDSTFCQRPRKRENYTSICKQLQKVMEMVKKPGNIMENP